jgi:hypothetical protein
VCADEDDAGKQDAAAADKAKPAGSEAGGITSRKPSMANLGRPSETGALAAPLTPRASTGKGIRFSVTDMPEMSALTGPEASRPSYVGRLQGLLDGDIDVEDDQEMVAQKILNGGCGWECHDMMAGMPGVTGGTATPATMQPHSCSRHASGVLVATWSVRCV